MPGPSGRAAAGERLPGQRAEPADGRRERPGRPRPPGDEGRGRARVGDLHPAGRPDRDGRAQRPLPGRAAADRRARLPDRRGPACLRPAGRADRPARVRWGPWPRRRGRPRRGRRRALAARRRGPLPGLRRRAGAAHRARHPAPVRLRPCRARGGAGDARPDRRAAGRVAGEGALVSPPRSGDLWAMVAIVVLTGFAAFLAAAQTSLTRMSRIRANHLLEQKQRGAGPLLRLVENPPRFLNLVLLLLLVTQFSATALATSVAERLIGGGIGLAVAITGMTILTFVFAEVAPKTLAVQQTDRVALRIAPVVWLLVRLPVLGPLTRLFISIGNVVAPGKGLASGPFVSEDELRALVDEAERGEG